MNVVRLAREGLMAMTTKTELPGDPPLLALPGDLSHTAKVTTESSSEPSGGLQLSGVLPELAIALDVPIDALKRYYEELRSSVDFVDKLNTAVNDIPEFSGAHFNDIDDLRLFRCLLYVLTRVLKPSVFVETGTLNGFSSAFILLALRRNGRGTLHSIDLPPADLRILAQGNRPLPAGKTPGWVIPENLRDQHQLHIGRAEVLLPQVLQDVGPVDAFLHDSDHSYTHMIFELAFAWLNVRPQGWMVCDNVEANQAFDDFAKGAGVKSTVVASFDSPERTWKTGLIQKPA